MDFTCGFRISWSRLKCPLFVQSSIRPFLGGIAERAKSTIGVRRMAAVPFSRAAIASQVESGETSSGSPWLTEVGPVPTDPSHRSANHDRRSAAIFTLAWRDGLSRFRACLRASVTSTEAIRSDGRHLEASASTCADRAHLNQRSDPTVGFYRFAIRRPSSVERGATSRARSLRFDTK